MLKRVEFFFFLTAKMRMKKCDWQEEKKSHVEASYNRSRTQIFAREKVLQGLGKTRKNQCDGS